MENSHDVFISYSHNDAEFMHHIRNTLEEYGLTVWTDEKLEVGSESWKKAIKVAIQNSKCLICVLSPSSANSKWVIEELTIAELHNKQIYPVAIKGQDREIAIVGIATKQWVDVRKEANFSERIDDLCRLIKETNFISVRDITTAKQKPHYFFTSLLFDPSRYSSLMNSTRFKSGIVHLMLSILICFPIVIGYVGWLSSLNSSNILDLSNTQRFFMYSIILLLLIWISVAQKDFTSNKSNDGIYNFIVVIILLIIVGGILTLSNFDHVSMRNIVLFSISFNLGSGILGFISTFSNLKSLGQFVRINYIGTIIYMFAPPLLDVNLRQYFNVSSIFKYLDAITDPNKFLIDQQQTASYLFSPNPATSILIFGFVGLFTGGILLMITERRKKEEKIYGIDKILIPLFFISCFLFVTSYT